jgi:hypothetical protein
VSFSHAITPTSHTNSPGTIVSGRVDHGIGRVLKAHRNYRKRRFESLLLAVEAKTALNLVSAMSQLVVYLASIRQSRLSRGRSDASVYGVASDGYDFIFVTITHDGTLQRSKRFGVEEGAIRTILGCLKYVLEKSESLSPNVTPEQKDGHQLDVDGSDPFSVDDSEYMTPQGGEDEDEDEE